MVYNVEDTIAAIATPFGKGGIGIIRISGKNAINISQKLFKPHNTFSASAFKIESHRAYYGKIMDPENQSIIDEVILLPMLAPKSYTREDIIEIHAHSGPAVLEKILKIVLQQDARIAEPGEFTKRAFLNGRIDLTQAEAIMDMINAETESARKIALTQLDGSLKNELNNIQSSILKAMAEIEAQIEFAEDHGENYIHKDLWETTIWIPLKNMNNNAQKGIFLKDGIKVALAGKPNVGKSSIMNRLLCQDRSIVTPFCGTTRDHIEEHFYVDGINIKIIDTAGIRNSQNPIEMIGIEKSREIIQKADMVLMICDASNMGTPEDENVYQSIRHQQKILVVNKKDLIGHQVKNGCPQWKNEKTILVSALYNEGIEELKQMIVELVMEHSHEGKNGVFISNIRQKKIIENALKAVENAIAYYEEQGLLEIVAMEFQEAKKQIDKALGVDISVDVLDQVFSEFCVGK